MSEQDYTRPGSDEYYMYIAMAVRKRANCKGRKVGAVLVLEDRVIATGYNGTPEDVKNCDEGGCDRCAHRDNYESGTGYDFCICVHAEQNVLLTSARFGNKVQGAVLHTTVQPCFSCTKELLQAKVEAVHYLSNWTPPDSAPGDDYERLQARFHRGCKKVVVADPDEGWANPPRGQTGGATGELLIPA